MNEICYMTIVKMFLSKTLAVLTAVLRMEF